MKKEDEQWLAEMRNTLMYDLHYPGQVPDMIALKQVEVLMDIRDLLATGSKSFKHNVEVF